MAGVLGSEVERRRRAMELIDEGESKVEVARRVGRSRVWVHKWRRRFEADGDAGLVDGSRARLSQPATSQRVVDRVLSVRGDLEDDPVASVGGLSILASLEREGFTPLPSVATIERILHRAARTRPYQRQQRSGNRLPFPVVASPGVWQQADWIQDRWLEGGTRFNSLQFGDVASHGIVSAQYPQRSIANAVTALWERAWPFLSIPQALGTDNAFVATTHPNNPWTEWVLICLYFGVEVIVSPPHDLGWTNHIEAVNNLWQSRTINRHRFRDLDELRAGSDRACDWFNQARPVLDPTRCGTRYPAQWISAHASQLRWPPDLHLNDHRDPKGRLHIPLSTGRITYLRHVTDHHTINVTHHTWTVPPTIPTGALVTATIDTAEHTLTIRHGGTIHTTHPYPIPHPATNSYYPPARHGLLDHL